MQALNIDINTNDTQMAIIPMSEYIALVENIENEVEKRLVERDRQNGIPHVQLHRVIDGQNPIKVYREWRGFTQKHLADTCHTSQANIVKLESFDGVGSIPILLNIAEALDIDFEHLVRFQYEGYENNK